MQIDLCALMLRESTLHYSIRDSQLRDRLVESVVPHSLRSMNEGDPLLTEDVPRRVGMQHPPFRHYSNTLLVPLLGRSECLGYRERLGGGVHSL